MKARKMVYGIWTAALLLAACSRGEEVIPEAGRDYIRFGVPGMEVEAKSTLVNGTLPEGSQFGVLGYCLAQVAPDDTTLNSSSGSVSWDTKKELCRPHLFHDVPMKYSDGECTYAPLQPWDSAANYQYTFFAYYPYGNFELLSGEYERGTPRVKFTMPFNGTNRDAELVGEVPDAMVAMAENAVRGTNGMVKLEFYHLLVGMNFQINNYNEDPLDATQGETVTIHSLKLKGTFFKSLEVKYDEGWSYPGDTFSGTYTLVQEGEDVSVPYATSLQNVGDRTLLFVFGESDTGGIGHLGRDISLEISYTFMPTEGGEYETKSDEIPLSLNTTPVRGTIYTMQLNFVGDSFVLNMVLDSEQWEDGSDTDITFE